MHTFSVAIHTTAIFFVVFSANPVNAFVTPDILLGRPSFTFVLLRKLYWCTVLTLISSR